MCDRCNRADDVIRLLRNAIEAAVNEVKTRGEWADAKRYGMEQPRPSWYEQAQRALDATALIDKELKFRPWSS